MDVLNDFRAADQVEALRLAAFNQIFHRGLLVLHRFELVVDPLHLRQMFIGKLNALRCRIDTEYAF